MIFLGLQFAYIKKKIHPKKLLAKPACSASNPEPANTGGCLPCGMHIPVSFNKICKLLITV